jgi:hypothetical protein
MSQMFSPLGTVLDLRCAQIRSPGARRAQAVPDVEDLTVDSGRSSRMSSSASAAEDAFVGRDRELGLGLTLLDEVLRGRGRLLLITGEPGIGKSRLAEELATQAGERGAQVVWGRCWEAGGAPAYWPWIQSLRLLMHKTDAVELGAALG